MDRNAIAAMLRQRMGGMSVPQNGPTQSGGMGGGMPPQQSPSAAPPSASPMQGAMGAMQSAKPGEAEIILKAMAKRLEMLPPT